MTFAQWHLFVCDVQTSSSLSKQYPMPISQYFKSHWTQHLTTRHRQRKNASRMHNSLDASWMCRTHRAWVQSWPICGLEVKLARFQALALTCQAHYACALLYLCPPFTEAFPHSSKWAHNLQSPIQSCLPKAFLGLDYDLLWQIFSVNNTANRKREEWLHSLAKDLLVI